MEEKRSQNEQGHLIGDDTFFKFITFIYTFNTKDPASVAIFQRNHPWLWFKIAQCDIGTVLYYFILLTLS